MAIKKLLNFFLVVIILFSLVLYREDIIFNVNKTFFNPCNSPIYYTIGTISPEFGVAEEELLLAVKDAAGEWNKVAKRNLLEYSQEGIEINLLYDYRQETTSQMEDLDSSYEVSFDKYNQLEDEYKNYIDIYNNKKNELEVITVRYNERHSIYLEDVSLWNKGQKYSVEEYDRINKEKEEIKSILYDIRQKQDELSQLAKNINYLIGEINKLATRLNINADKYNKTSEILEEEFEQGNYTNNYGKKEINIYQFEDKESLAQVLMHEFGHALNLDHSMNPDDIMYWNNTKEEQTITNSSLDQLRKICYE